MRIAWLVGLIGVLWLTLPVSGAEPASFDRDIAPLLKRHCVKCHGPAKREGKLNLSLPGGLLRGGTNGAAIIPHDAEGSMLWQRVNSDEMPPESPLSVEEKQLLRRWIVEGTRGLRQTDSDVDDHWAFQILKPSAPWKDESTGTRPLDAASSPVDQFLLRNLAQDELSYLPEADRYTQIRRVSIDLLGLPPTPEAIAEFVNDTRPDAYSRMVDRYLASPHFGERLGKVWLDAAGYADSNGYFNADTDRPLAYRYRDYVIRSFNADKPYPDFIREQIAGDELARVTARPGDTIFASAEREDAAQIERTIELLEATHFLRNGQDGTGESDGNPDEVRIDRYTVLETAMQNISTGLLGLTIQCAKCHDHKFEPLTQRDYYGFQAVLIPAFPPEQWMKPNDRIIYASLPGELEAWQSELITAETNLSRLQSELSTWVHENRPRGKILFADDFNAVTADLGDRWSGTAPAGSLPAGTASVRLNSREAPSALIVDGRLQLIEGGPVGDKSLSTKEMFDWSPDVIGGAIQVTFDLVDNHVENSQPAERIGYLLALNNLHPERSERGGNVLVDGHPSGGTVVHSDYPGIQSKSVGTIGKTNYISGRNYGVRITNLGEGKFQLQHLVDGIDEEPSVKLDQADLPRGAFGFEFCCGRSYVVDNVVVESFTPENGIDPLAEFAKALKARRTPLDDAVKAKTKLANAKPGKIAWSTDIVDPPQVHVLERGNYNSPGEPVEPAGFSVLGNMLPPQGIAITETQPTTERRGSGRRLAFANWLTEPDSKRSSLLARVHVNRLWQHLFGIGIVATADNFGLSGPTPTDPELLNWLASDFVRSNGSTKRSLRFIVNSAAYRQSSFTGDASLQKNSAVAKADSRRLSHFPIRRLDAEAIRDGLLASSGELDDRMYGPYVATTRSANGETIVAEDNPGVRRRSLYLQQRRTQVHSLLQVFDAPSIVFNSTRRPRSTMPLQSLSLLNSDFVVTRANHLSKLLEETFSNDRERQEQAFLLTTGRPPSDADRTTMTSFLQQEMAEYPDAADGRSRAWSDLCQILLIGNAVLYVE